MDDIGGGVEPRLLASRIVGQPILPHGGFAEVALMNADEAYIVPRAIDDSVAATLHLTYLTAWLALTDGRRSSPVILVITAAAGGVGSAAVQVARAAGATVIAIVSDADKAAAAAGLGADQVIDRSGGDVIEQVKDSAPEEADIVFDSVGGKAYEQATNTSPSKAGSWSSDSPAATFHGRTSIMP